MPLTGCTPAKQIVRTEYVYPTIPPLPAEPEYYPVVFGRCAEGYCLDEKNAKNLLKNLTIEDAHAADLKSILESLKRK
jgi:hypothetical protein